MNEGVPLFTAARLAAWRGVSRKRVHQWMVGVKPRLVKGPGGLASHWKVSDLPAWLHRELETDARRLAYRDVAALLAAPPQPWQPKHALAELSHDAVTKARVRMEVLAPLLAAEDAEIVPVSKLVSRALETFRQQDGRMAAGEWSVREWIDNARERDRSLCRWDRVEIYLDENPPLKPAREEETEIADGIGARVEREIAEVGDKRNPTSGEKDRVWNAVFHEYEGQLSKGVKDRVAKRRLLQILDARLPGLVPTAASARSMAWQRLFDRWLEGQRNADAFADNRSHRSGRKPAGYVTEEEQAAIQAIVRKVPGFHRITGLLLYARSPKCVRPELREIIRRHRKSAHSMPEWLMKAATLPENMQLKETGERKFRAEAFSVKRGSFEIMSDGTQREIEAGDWWLFDDMSQNNPFWFENLLADDDDELARKQQVSICRQSLMAMDLRSGRWLGCELIGRSRDSYRAEDILRFFFRLFVLYGLPRRGIILENGIWRCKVIAGTQDRVIEISKEDQERVTSGLRALGIEVRHAIDAKGKALIESGFRHYQNLAAASIDGLYIGRKVGDHERGMKQFVRARAGVVHPARVNMLHIERANVEASRVMGLCNEWRKEGEIQNGVPDEVWDRALAAAPLRRMPMERLHVLMPSQREVKIRGGHVRPKVNGRELCFTNAERFAMLGNDYRLRVHFDASEPSLGAWVFNLETSTQNTDGYKLGQFICKADFAEEAPQMAFPGYTDDNIRRRKAYNGAVRIAFSAPARNGQQAATAHEVRDGRGNVVRVEHGTSTDLQRAAQSVSGSARRGGTRSDELAAKARALKESRRPKIDIDALVLETERKELEMIKAGRLEPYYLTDAQEARLAVLRATPNPHRNSLMDLLDT